MRVCVQIFFLLPSGERECVYVCMRADFFLLPSGERASVCVCVCVCGAVVGIEQK